MRTKNELSATHEILCKEWHPTRNGNFKPSDFTYGSHKKIWWICEKGHEWQAEITNRARLGKGCPYCSHRLCLPETCVAMTHPKLLREWNFERNEIDPNKISAGSARKIWWICDKRHEWQAVLRTRTKQCCDCPYCCGKKPTHTTCLAATHPHLLDEWDFYKNKINPYEVKRGTVKNAWWICDKGHEWQCNIDNRALKGYNCPYCSGRKVCADNCLSVTHPNIAAQWHPIKNKMTPRDFTHGSGVKIWWICGKQHEWRSSIYSRTGCVKAGCPICNESKGEIEIANVLEQLSLSFKRQWRFSSCKNKMPLPFDFVIKTNYGVKLIEYQGEQHYKPVNFTSSKKDNEHLLEVLQGIQKRDNIKKKWCVEKGLPLLEIPYWEFENIEKLVKTFCIRK